MKKCELNIRILDENAVGCIFVSCTGDTDITQKATPAQILANKCMEFIAKELESEE